MDEIITRARETPDSDQVSITKVTLDRMLKSDNPSDATTLYLFYAYTAKWQDTDQIKCTINYACKGLGWGDNRVRAAKKTLVDLKLVEDHVDKDEDTKRVKGWYIKVFYLTRGIPYEKPPLSDSIGWTDPQGGEEQPKCLRTNKEKCSLINKEMLVFEKMEDIKPPWDQ